MAWQGLRKGSHFKLRGHTQIYEVRSIKRIHKIKVGLNWIENSGILLYSPVDLPGAAQYARLLHECEAIIEPCLTKNNQTS